MSAINDGGPAFPVPMFTRQSDGQPMSAGDFFEGGNGLSLRDWFAAHASEEDIQEMKLLHRTPINGTDLGDGYGPDYNTISRQEARFFHAESMLAARERKEDA